jgi:dihydroflavonol-4-reductase
MQKTAFVTGGTGFIGLNLIEQLLADGWDVTALHRPTSDLTYLQRFPVRLVEGTVTDRASLEKGMPAGLDAVFHVAGDTNFWKKNNDRQTRTNVEGTSLMLDVARQKQARCFVHTSSISAWGTVYGLIDEDTPSRGQESGWNYERTKLAGEKLVLAVAGQGMKVVVMNPGAVVGPYDKTTWGTLFLLTRAGKLPPIATGAICITHVREVVNAHIAAVERGRDGQKYILGGINTDYYTLASQITQLMGAKPPQKIPGSLLRALGKVLGWMADLTGKEPVITYELADGMTRQNIHHSSEKAKRELGFQDVPLEVCVRDCYDWMVAEKLL